MKMKYNVPIVVASVSILFLLIDANFTLFFYDKIFVTESKLRSHLYGKRIWLTGASSGIGATLADELAKKGAKLVLSSRRKEKLESMAKDFRTKYQNDDTTVIPFDMNSEPEHLEAVVDEVLNSVGGIDILILNAGIFQEGPALDITRESQAEVMKINFLSHTHLAMELIRRDEWKTNNKGGHIVVTSSFYGLALAPYSAIYAASKRALNGFFHVLRIESLGWNLKVNIICPGPVKTEIFNSAVINHQVKDDISFWGNVPFKMSSERCVRLMMSAMIGPGRFFSEVWIVQYAMIVFYLNQYIPSISNGLLTVAGNVMVKHRNDELGLFKKMFS